MTFGIAQSSREARRKTRLEVSQTHLSSRRSALQPAHKRWRLKASLDKTASCGPSAPARILQPLPVRLMLAAPPADVPVDAAAQVGRWLYAMLPASHAAHTDPPTRGRASPPPLQPLSPPPPRSASPSTVDVAIRSPPARVTAGLERAKIPPSDGSCIVAVKIIRPPGGVRPQPADVAMHRHGTDSQLRSALRQAATADDRRPEQPCWGPLSAPLPAAPQAVHQAPVPAAPEQGEAAMEQSDRASLERWVAGEVAARLRAHVSVRGNQTLVSSFCLPARLPHWLEKLRRCHWMLYAAVVLAMRLMHMVADSILPGNLSLRSS